MPEKVIELSHISVFFNQDGQTLKAVNDVSLDVERAIFTGSSGIPEPANQRLFG